MIYIFDLDGTLCDNKHRLHYITGETKDYQAYHTACIDDEPLPLVHLLDLISCNTRWMGVIPKRIMFYTGRSNIAYRQTVEWLHNNCSAYDMDQTILNMRKEGDWREDFVIKQEWLLDLLKYTPASQIIAFDDRKQCVDMYRRHGVTCCQVSDGEF